MLNLKIQKDQILNKGVEMDFKLGAAIVLQKALELSKEYLKIADGDEPDNLIVKLASIDDNGDNKSMVMSKDEFESLIDTMRDDMNEILTSKVILESSGNNDDMYIDFNRSLDEFKEITKEEMMNKIGIDVILVVDPNNAIE